jgi:uncharacterized protein
MVQKLYVTYNDVRKPTCLPTSYASPKSYHVRMQTDGPPSFPPKQVHKLCQEAAPRLLEEVNPQLMIAIGGGGYVPARILRSFLKRPGNPNIPIQAIGLSLYEQLPTSTDADVEEAGTKVTRTQWLDLSALGEMGSLVGKRILIVDEVDDTRTTLEYAVKELEKDVEVARAKFGGEAAQFSVFVLHVSPPLPLSRPSSSCLDSCSSPLLLLLLPETPKLTRGDSRTRTSKRRAHFLPR